MAHHGTSCLLIGALPFTLVNFRGPLIRAMRAKGLTVFAAASGRDADTGEILKQVGIELEPRSDNLITLEAKQAVAGANALAEWIAQNEPPFADCPPVPPPPGESRFYNSPGLRDYRRFQKILRSIC